MFLVLLTIATIGSFAQAETVMTTAKPTPINISAAIKSKTPVAKCEFKHMGETGRLKNKKGSKAFFTAVMPKEDPKAGDIIADGKDAYVCKTMSFDRVAGKFSAAD